MSLHVPIYVRTYVPISACTYVQIEVNKSPRRVDLDEFLQVTMESSKVRLRERQRQRQRQRQRERQKQADRQADRQRDREREVIQPCGD